MKVYVLVVAVKENKSLPITDVSLDADSLASAISQVAEEVARRPVQSSLRELDSLTFTAMTEQQARELERRGLH